MKAQRLIVAAAVAAVLAGCAYTPLEVLPDHIHSIAVPTFKNLTSRYGIEEKLTQKVIEEFIRDGRLNIASPESAHSLLQGEIVLYVRTPLSYDQNDVVEQYAIRVLVNMTYHDLVDNKILWTEKREQINGNLVGGIEDEVRYYVSARRGEAVESEDEAQDRLVERLAEDIMKRTVYGWRSSIEIQSGLMQRLP